MNNARLVILVGVDGSGKTTLLNGLEKYGYKVSHWKRLKTIIPNKLDYDTPAYEVQKLSGKKRLDFIHKYISFEWKYLIYPSLQEGINVISDGFFIRFLVKEKIYKK